MTHNTTPTPWDDIIDSRDIIDALEHMDPTDDGYAGLSDLAAECDLLPDWHYGVTLIRDSYFTEYAQDLAEDCGLLRADTSWPYTCIDWECAARELQYDYYPVTFAGVTYWTR